MPETTAARCTGLLTALQQRLTSRAFLERHRQAVKDFTRERCLPFVVVVLFLLNLVKRALQDELDAFFNLEPGAAVAAQVVTKSAFCQARLKRKADAFVELHQVQGAYFYAQWNPPTWHGFRLLAVDGSTLQLPAAPAIVAEFGLWGTRPLARASQMFDVLSKVTLDAQLGVTAVGEREYAAGHFAQIGPGDLILLDRGYPAFWLFSLIQTRAADFCARMPLGLWSVVDAFLTTGRPEQIVTLTPCAAARADCQTHQVPSRPLQVRLVRITLDSGEVEVLCTSLLDAVRYPYAVFKDLYHHRWPVEEDYKVLKLRVEVENWSGKSPLSIYQDFHAKVFTTNLTAILAQPAQAVVAQHSQTKQYTYQVNFAHLLSKMKNTVVLLLRRTHIADILTSLWQIMISVVEPIRPGRKYPRDKTTKRRRFAMTYKPLH